MRIAIDGSSAQRALGGVSEYSFQILQALADLKTRHDFLITTTGVNNQALGLLPPLPKNFQEIRIRLPQRLLSLGWRYLGWPPVTNWLPKIDLFFAPHFLVPAGNFPKLVVTIHDVLFLDHPEWFLPDDVVYYTGQLKKTLGRADQVIAISQSTKQDLVRHRLFPAHKISVTPLAVAYQKPTRAEQQAVRAKYQLPEHYLLFISTLEPRKNIVRLIRAYRKLSRKYSDLPQLVLAGRRGWLGQELDEALANETPSNNIHLLGSFDRADRGSLLASAQGLLFPSLGEGFGLPILEGMAAGVPVLTSNLSSMPEVAGEAALLVDPFDEAALAEGIEQLLFDQALRQKLIAAGYERAQTFTWRKTAQKTLAVFEKVV